MTIIRMLHAIAGIWFVSGLIGRWMTYAQARGAAGIQTAGALLQLSDRFERAMVIPGSQLVLALGLGTAWLQHRPILGSPAWLTISLVLFVGLIPAVMFLLVPRRRRRLAALEAALAQGTLTPELRTALDDKVVIGCRAVELLVVAVVLVLMILKPF